MAVLRKKDRPITGSMVHWYAKTTRHDMPAFVEVAQRLEAHLPAGAEILEVAPGPGFLAIELAKRKFKVTGLELSAGFVDLARQNAREAGAQVDFRQGNASETGLPSEAYDFIVCRAAFKNFGQPVQALNEMHRVLKPGAQALIIDLRKDADIAAINQYVNASGRSGPDALFTKLIFRHFLIRTAYSQTELERMIRESHFSQARIDRAGIGFEIWLTK